MKVLFLCLMIVCLSWADQTSYSITPKNLSCNCGWRNGGRIVGGVETNKNEYPWMVSLNNGCGGSIITRYHILTAAHCTDGYAPSYLKVSVGRHYRSGPNKRLCLHRVHRIIQHKDYQKYTETCNDISVIVLATPINFSRYVGPVCLPKRRYPLEGKFVKITGWGLTEDTGDNNVLREVDLEVISRDVCKRSWRDLNRGRTQLCTSTPDKDSCDGDSGGPLVYLDPDTNRYTQVALVSYGDSDCRYHSKPSVNTDVYSYISWIKKATQQRPKAQFCTKIK